MKTEAMQEKVTQEEQGEEAILDSIPTRGVSWYKIPLFLSLIFILS